MHGQQGSDTLIGGDGDDTFYFDSQDTLDGGSGFDQAYLSANRVEINDKSAIKDIEVIHGTRANDAILVLWIMSHLKQVMVLTI